MAGLRSGFTLVEILVVIAISVLLSGLAIGYSNISRNEITLTVESAKIAQFILQAKQLAIATHAGDSGNGSPVYCGYGVVFNTLTSPQTYSIFAYSPVSSPVRCPAPPVTNIPVDQMKEYSRDVWRIAVSPGVVLQTQQSDVLSAVLFYPPVPTTYLSSDGVNFPFPASTHKVYLTTADGKGSATISVNAGGQVNY